MLDTRALKNKVMYDSMRFEVAQEYANKLLNCAMSNYAYKRDENGEIMTDEDFNYIRTNELAYEWLDENKVKVEEELVTYLIDCIKSWTTKPKK